MSSATRPASPGVTRPSFSETCASRKQGHRSAPEALGSPVQPSATNCPTAQLDTIASTCGVTMTVRHRRRSAFNGWLPGETIQVGPCLREAVQLSPRPAPLEYRDGSRQGCKRVVRIACPHGVQAMRPKPRSGPPNLVALPALGALADATARSFLPSIHRRNARRKVRAQPLSTSGSYLLGIATTSSGRSCACAPLAGVDLARLLARLGAEWVEQPVVADLPVAALRTSGRLLLPPLAKQ